MPEQPAPLDTWAIVEVMGHKQFAGHVTEQLFGSAALIRIDVPATEQPAAGWQDATSPLPPRMTAPYSKLVGVGSIYCITPCTEEVARLAAQRLERYNNPIPVALPASHQLAAAVVDASDDPQYDDFGHDALDDDE